MKKRGAAFAVGVLAAFLVLGMLSSCSKKEKAEEGGQTADKTLYGYDGDAFEEGSEVVRFECHADGTWEAWDIANDKEIASGTYTGNPAEEGVIEVKATKATNSDGELADVSSDDSCTVNIVDNNGTLYIGSYGSFSSWLYMSFGM